MEKKIEETILNGLTQLPGWPAIYRIELLKDLSKKLAEELSESLSPTPSSLPTDEEIRKLKEEWDRMSESIRTCHHVLTDKIFDFFKPYLRTNFSSEKWISVEDELPENHERYLCRAMLSNCFVDAVCLFDKDSQFYRWLYENKEVEVTHWQPLPNPPKQNGK